VIIVGLISWFKQSITCCPFAKHTEDSSLQTQDIAKTQNIAGVAGQPAGFLATIQQVEAGHPIPPQPTLPDANDAKYTNNPAAYTEDKQTYDTALVAYATAAKARGTAVAGVIGSFLANKPFDMLQELLDQPEATMPIFSPVVGPVIVMRHKHVIKCLERTDLFTVDRYAEEMARATDDKTKCPQAFSHFMLGTDNDELYRLDGVLLRHVVTPNDKATVTKIARIAANTWLKATLASGSETIDIVASIARDVPLQIVSDYLGVHGYKPGEASVLPGLRGGDVLPLSDSLQKVFTFHKINQGIVPTWDQLHDWIQDAFRNIFNNGNPSRPNFQEFRERGIIATEYLSNYVHELIQLYKGKLVAGEPVPDTMLTRLIRLQQAVEANQADDLEKELTDLLGQPLPADELAKRLSDSMIRSNVFGTAVGAVANPQEAMSWIADVMLNLKDGKYMARHGSDFNHAVDLANVADDAPKYEEASEALRRYALEALRLQPQGEVLLRMCVKDNTELGNVLIRKGTLVFAGYGAAMRDKTIVEQPLAFDITRAPQLTPYLGQADRKNEDPQSQIYLQHGYGRHKCLGRYASEITMQESLRAILRLGDITRQSEVIMDEQNIYPASLKISFTRKN
jgi:cytochrome P450